MNFYVFGGYFNVDTLNHNFFINIDFLFGGLKDCFHVDHNNHNFFSKIDIHIR